MARETKAQREAREAEERRLQHEEDVRTYPERLMLVMQRAVNHNFELTMREGKFVVYDRDERRPDEHTMAVTYDGLSESMLSDLDWAVELKAKEEEERTRKERARQAALAKLSKEERELLGV